jgi:hypothetical protein
MGKSKHEIERIMGDMRTEEEKDDEWNKAWSAFQEFI